MSKPLPNNWTYARLDQAAIVVAGNPAPQGSEYFENGEFDFVRVHDMGLNGNNTFLANTRDLINAKAAIKMRLFPSGSVLFTKSGASTLLNQRAILAKDSYVVSHIAAAVPFEDISAKWLFYFLLLVDFATLAHATNMPSLPLSRAKEIRVPIAPAPEQHRIVAKIEELFSELDKGVESLKTARAKLNVYRQAVLKHAFEGKLTAQWREENEDKLETPEQLLARIKQKRAERYGQQLIEWKIAVKAWEARGRPSKKPSKPGRSTELRRLNTDHLANLAPLPEGHAYTYLANLGELGRGKSKHRPRNAPELFGGSYPFIQTGEVKAAGRIIRQHSQTYSELGLKQSKLWLEGTLCITIAANIAETAFLGFDGCFPDSVVGFTAAKTLVLPEYVELFIKSVRTRIEAYAPATAQKNINLAALESLVVPVCSLEEQRILVDQLEAVMSVIEVQRDAIVNQLSMADALRQSVLKKAFGGQLVAQDPSDEPASVLLERIREEREKTLKYNTLKKTKRRKTAA